MSLNRQEFTDRLNYAQREVEFLQRVEMNCTRCNNFDDKERFCMKFGDVPPEFVAQGCDEWIFDEVPF